MSEENKPPLSILDPSGKDVAPTHNVKMFCLHGRIYVIGQIVSESDTNIVMNHPLMIQLEEGPDDKTGIGFAALNIFAMQDNNGSEVNIPFTALMILGEIHPAEGIFRSYLETITGLSLPGSNSIIT